MAEINEKLKPWARRPTDAEWERIWKDYEPQTTKSEQPDERAPRK